jgi:KDO2-lipid IV(A) lauroyltransferase
MKRILWGLQTAVFYISTWALAIIPGQYILTAGRLTGRILYRVLSNRRRIAVDNIRQALPFMKTHPAFSSPMKSPEAIASETFMHLGISIVEVSRLYHGKGDSIIRGIEVRGRENFDRARAKHKGLIIIGGHCGNWELLSLSFKILFDENGWGIARHQNNPYLNTLVERMRTIYGTELIYSKASLRRILGVIKNDGVIGMLADQAVFPENGALIEMLGRKAWANKAPAIIAHKTGVPLIPVFMHRENDRHILTIHPEYELCGDRSENGILRDIQALSRYLEDFVCAHPADWYWVHRRWKRAGEPV